MTLTDSTVSNNVAGGYVGGIDKNTWKWQALGEDLKRVNAEVVPLGPELMKLGVPTAIYSTPVTKTAKDRPIDGESPIGKHWRPVGRWSTSCLSIRCSCL